MKRQHYMVYLGREERRIKGSFHGVTKIYKTWSGMIFEFNTPESAQKAFKVFCNSGYEVVRLI